MDEHGWRNGVFLHVVLRKKMCRKLSWCHRFSTLPCVMPRQKSPKSVCSAPVEVLRNAVSRWSGRCSCRDAFAFAHHSKQAKKSLSPSESSVCEEPDYMFNMKCVVWSSTNLLFGFSFSLIFQKQNKFLHSIVSQKSFSFMHF